MELSATSPYKKDNVPLLCFHDILAIDFYA